MAHRVVARFPDGRMVKGVTRDFDHGRRAFHIQPQDPTEDCVQVYVRDLKAVFFVQRWQGDRYYDEHSEWTQGAGSRVEVTFRDGEQLRGFTVDPMDDQQGFYLQPVDRNSNNERVYVVYRSVQRVDFV